jgi:UDP-GlcNAc:undecaprenyl-phosphate GlcNAc-1-phosphate transferase
VKATATVSMIAPVLALGLPIMDTLLAVFRRSMAGTPLFHADNVHVHHRLLKRGLSHRQAVLVLYGVSFFLAVGAILSVFMRGRIAATRCRAICRATPSTCPTPSPPAPSASRTA